MKTCTIIRWRQNRQDPLGKSKVNQINLCDMMWGEEVKVALGGNNIFIGNVITTTSLNLWQTWFGRWNSCSIQARFVVSNELFWLKSSRCWVENCTIKGNWKLKKQWWKDTKAHFQREATPLIIPIEAFNHILLWSLVKLSWTKNATKVGFVNCWFFEKCNVKVLKFQIAPKSFGNLKIMGLGHYHVIHLFLFQSSLLYMFC